MILREVQPEMALAGFVRLYRIIDFEFPDDNPIPPKAYTPRPEQCLQFFPTPTAIGCTHTKQNIRPKNALLFGQQTVINNRTVFKKFLSLQIVFQPGALYRLFSFSTSELTNRLINAEDIFGAEVEHVNDALYHAKNHQELIAIAGQFMMKAIKRAAKQALPMDAVAQQMLNPTQALDWYISNAFVSHRQFNRQFINRVGISPKAYLRVVRFDQAYRLKNRHPEMSWFNIAIACGYHDYQHLSKDYLEFTGYTPSAFFAIDSPERLLGTEEVY